MNFNNAEFITSYGTASQLPQSDLPEIVFSGRSNVGKSTLINKLFSRKNLARVSSVPGKTVTLNFFRCDNVNFVDLPGYGYAKSSLSEIERWGKATEKFFNSGRKTALVIQLIDFRRRATELDYQMLDFLKHTKTPFLIVFTKTDKLNKGEYNKRLSEIQNELGEYDAEAILFSSVSGEGVQELKLKIEEALSTEEKTYEL